MSDRRFECSDVDRLLDLEDVSRRPDRAALARHLAGCPRCRALAPELEWLYGKLEAGALRAAPRRGRRVAAALVAVAVALVAIVTVIGLDRAGPAVDRGVEPGLETEAPPRLLPAHHSHFEAGVVRLLPDQELRSSSSSTMLSPDVQARPDPAPMEWSR
jgi:hypothetical protein